MSSSAPWSCGSRRRRDDRGVVHRLPEDRLRRAPRCLLPAAGGVGVVVLQVASAAADGPPAAPRRPRRGGEGVLRGLRRHARHVRVAAVWEDLVAAGWKVSKNTVAVSMARQDLQGRSPKRKRRCLTRPDAAAEPIPDLVGRDFHAERIDQRWCGDLTEIPTEEGKLYLATVLDLASRRLAGFAMGDHHDSALAKAALCVAAAVRGGDIDGVIFHTDHGGEYVGELFARACSSLGVTQSMGRVGSALDNAAAESFNSTLEHELLSRRRFATKDQARRQVARFVDVYNHRRRHSSCEMLPPVAYEQLLAERADVAQRAQQDRVA